MDYVCFSDEPDSDTFFTFVAHGYDQEYAEVYAKWFKLVTDSSSDFQEVEKYYRRMQTIERTADYPYLHFFSADEFNEYTSAAQKVWRDGIRSLMAHVYEKGVKVASRMYHAGYKFDFKTVFEDAW